MPEPEPAEHDESSPPEPPLPVPIPLPRPVDLLAPVARLDVAESYIEREVARVRAG